MESRAKKRPLEKGVKSYSLLRYSSIKTSGEITRPITVINGVPIYRSTGRNSGLKDTWLPFLGMNGDVYEKCSRAWFLKPHGGVLNETKLYEFYPYSVVHLVSQHFKTTHHDKRVRRFLGRFACLQAMAISAAIGGGFWNLEYGQKLKEYLQEQHSDLMPKQPVKMDEIRRIKRKVDETVGKELKKERDLSAVAAVNGFIYSQNPNPLFFSFDKQKRRKVYSEFSSQKSLKYPSTNQ